MFTKEMFLRGQWLQDKVKDRYPDSLVLNHLIACAQLSKEVSEVLDCIPWKFERVLEPEPREKLLEELVDVFKFYIRLLVIHEVTEKEFQEAFNKKSDIVEKRLLKGETYVPNEQKH